MAFNANSLAQRRSNPFTRTSSPSPGPSASTRPKSALFSSPSSPGVSTSASNGISQSNNSFVTALVPAGSAPRHPQRDSRSGTPTSNTFAPSFIKTEDARRELDAVQGIEGENDFSGKRYVWLKDPQHAFVKGWVVEELGGNQILVQEEDGSVCAAALLRLPLC